MNTYTVFIYMMANLFDFLLVDLFITHNSNTLSRRNKLRPFFFSLRILHAAAPFTDFSLYLSKFLIIIQILICTDVTFKKRILTVVKYFIYYYASIFFIMILHMLIIRDFAQISSNVSYVRYNLFSGIIISYITASMHFNTEKVRALKNAKSHIFSYYFIIFFTITVFSIAPTLALPYVLNYKQFLPILLTLIAFIISIYLTTYSKIADTLEENATNKLQLNKNKWEISYKEQIDEKLRQLQTLRHDMKNHLLLIDSFANECNTEKIHSYIRQICSELQQTQIITSPSSALSSLLNTKKLICDEHRITFSTILDFSEIYIDDFTIITIISNLLDNAITAASKVADGYINLTIEQTDSYLSINCNNNHCEKIEKKEGSFISSKPSVNFHPDSTHGFGIKSFTDTVKKHGGSVNILYDANTFSVNILIPNYA